MRIANVRAQDTSQESSPTTLFSLKDLHHHAILSTVQLRRWDFPIFELQRQLDTFMLSKVRFGPARPGPSRLVALQYEQ